MFLTVYYRDFFMKSNSNIVCLQHRCIAYQNNCHIDLYTGWSIVKYYQCFKYTFFFTLSHISMMPVVSVILCFCLQTLMHILSKAPSCHLLHRTKDRVCVGLCVCVYTCLSVSKSACAFMHAPMCDLQLCEQTANGHRQQWDRGVCLAYQRYLWNVLSLRGASARCDPSRTVCSCPRHASSSEKKKRQQNRSLEAVNSADLARQ